MREKVQEGLTKGRIGAASERMESEDRINMMTSAVVECWEDLYSPELTAEWDGLVERSAANEVFSRLEWLRGWGVSGVRECRPAMVLLREGPRLVAVAPLMRARRRFCGVETETVEFAGAPNSDYSDFIYEDARHLAPLWDAVRRAVGGADVVRLQQVRRESATCPFLARRPGVVGRPCATGLTVKLPEDSDAPWEAYLKGRGLRRRTLTRIEREGPVDLVAHEGAEAVIERLPVLFEQHMRRWAQTRTPSFFEREEVRAAYRQWARELDRHVLFCELRLRGRPVATLFGFAYNAKLVVHSISFDVDYAKLHCGLYCIAAVMRKLRERGIEWVDFSRGLEPFKRFFADCETVNYEFHWLRTWKARCAAGGFLAAKELARRWGPARAAARALGYGLEAGG